MEAGAGTVEKEEGSAKKRCQVKVEKAAGKVRQRQTLNLKLQLDSGLCHTMYSIVVKSLGFETIKTGFESWLSNSLAV